MPEGGEALLEEGSGAVLLHQPSAHIDTTGLVAAVPLRSSGACSQEPVACAGGKGEAGEPAESGCKAEKGGVAQRWGIAGVFRVLCGRDVLSFVCEVFWCQVL